MRINIEDLIPTQSGIRKHKNVNAMAARLIDGKDFSHCNDKIVIKQFEDGKLYVHDGHHRLLAKMIVKEELLESEYILKQFKYDQFMTINLKVGWVTPFDPRTEIRIPNLKLWKKVIAKYIKHCKDEEQIENFIYLNASEYLRNRIEVFTMKDLLKIYNGNSI